MKKYLLPILLLSISLTACTGKAKDATISKPSTVSYGESQQSFVENQKYLLNCHMDGEMEVILVK